MTPLNKYCSEYLFFSAQYSLSLWDLVPKSCVFVCYTFLLLVKQSKHLKQLASPRSLFLHQTSALQEESEASDLSRINQLALFHLYRGSSRQCFRPPTDISRQVCVEHAFTAYFWTLWWCRMEQTLDKLRFRAPLKSLR